MSDKRNEARIRQLQDDLKALEERSAKAKANKEKTNAEIKQIKHGTRLKDRHLWLALWANGDRSVADKLRPLRDDIKVCKDEIAKIPRHREAIVSELRKIVTENEEQHNPNFRKLSTQQEELKRGKDVCDAALQLILTTQKRIRDVSSSMSANPRGKTRTTVERKTGDLSAQLQSVREQVAEVNKITSPRVAVSVTLRKKLNATFPGSDIPYQRRKSELQKIARTLDDVARQIKSSRDKIANDAKALENKHARLLEAKVNRLLR